MFRNFLNFPNNLPQAGRLKHFLAAWEQIAKDPGVLQVVSGYQVEFLDNPVQQNTPPPIPCSLDHQTIIDQEVWELLSKEAVHFVQPNSQQEPGFISSLFVIPKKGGGHRPVINLKPLNCFIPYEHFKMESIHMLKDLLKKGDYMVKIDLNDAYLTVPIWQNHQKYLRFLWRDSLLEFACLLFGLASAPRVFTKLLKLVLSILRQRGIRLIVYLDDILLMAPSVEQVLQHAASTLNLLEGLGFTVNYLKSVLVPSQQMEFLGSLVNSLDLSLSLPRDKIRKIQSKCQDLLNTPVTTVRELSKFLGLLSSSIQAVFPAPLHYRYLQQAKNSVIRFRKSYEAVVHLDSECLQELQWWKDNLVAWSWKALFQQSTDLAIETRCLPSRMGSLLSRYVDRRQMAPRRDFIPYQLPRIASRLTSHNVLRQEQSQGSGTTADGQHFSSNLHKQNGRDTLPHAILPSQKSMGLVPHPQYLGDSALHPRSTECRSGQGIESISRFQRLEISSRSFQPPPSEVGSP